MSAPLHPVRLSTRRGRPGARLLATLAALAVVAPGCDTGEPDALLAPDAPAAAQQSWTDRAGDIFWNSCAGEFVAFAEGALAHEVYQTRSDGNGGYLISYHANGAAYSGPGLDCDRDTDGNLIPSTCEPTGSWYQGNNTSNYTVHVVPPFPVIFTNARTTRVSRRGSGVGFLFHITDHFTVNANGEVTADVLDPWIECI